MSVPVDIYCDGRRAAGQDAKHDPWLVARWVRIDGEWARTGRVADAGAQPRFLKGQLAQLIQDGSPIESVDDWRPDARARYPMKCPRCRFDVVVTKSPKFVEFLDAHEPEGTPSPLLSEMVASLR
ncbi:hypothetical protein [Mycolicibacterium chubuense]|uniref:hypothetical protein n=1 Tax=Mycolicibacterium chubuense TaxID=1800 RepID=UPI00138AAE2A|nr:hypothetical protein [Mycolicibacterium chubuense]